MGNLLVGALVVSVGCSTGQFRANSDLPWLLRGH